jgi:hypothetical protein
MQLRHVFAFWPSMRYELCDWFSTIYYVCVLVGHYVAIIMSQLCHYVATRMPLVVTYVPLQGHNIGMILQLDGHYGVISWPLIKYYQFTIL